MDTIFPINNGVITDWDAMEYIWNQMYYEDLLVPPEDYNILHTESIMNNESSREKLVEVSHSIIIIDILQRKRSFSCVKLKKWQ